MVAKKNLKLAFAAMIGGVLVASCTGATNSLVRTNWETAYDQQDRPGNPATGSADATADDLRSLEDVLAHAEIRNPGLRAAFDRWTAALQQVPQAKSLPDPQLSYGYFLEPVETRVGAQRQRFGISQTIPLFGKLGLRGDIALHAANAAGARFERERLQLRYRVTEIWNDYRYLNRATHITEENVRLMTRFESVALARYTASKAPHATVIRAQVELGRLEDRLLTLRDQERSLLAALNAELNRPTLTAIPIPDSLAYVPAPHSSEELQNILAKNNPQLAALRSMVAKDNASAKLAGRNPIPDLTIGAEYIDTEQSPFPNVNDSGKDAAIAKATISVPLWFGKYRAEKAQANARRSASERELAHLHNQLNASLERAQFELRDAERRVELYRFTLLPKARQSLEVTEDAFTAGQVGFLDLIDAQQTFLEFELSYERALADRATTRAQLEMIAGKVLGEE